MNAIQRNERDIGVYSALLDGYRVGHIAGRFQLTTESVYRILNRVKEDKQKKGEWFFAESKWGDITRMVWASRTRMLYSLGWSEGRIAGLIGWSQSFVHHARKAEVCYPDARIVIRVVGHNVRTDDGKPVPPNEYTCTDGNGRYAMLHNTQTYAVRYDELKGQHEIVSAYEQE